MIKVEISHGELIDKYTILGIKLEKIQDPEKVKNIKRETVIIGEQVNLLYEKTPDIDTMVHLSRCEHELESINRELWAVEDSLRKLEREEFWITHEGREEFIDLARSVYRLNDDRADMKRRINDLTGSQIVEEKSYEQY